MDFLFNKNIDINPVIKLTGKFGKIRRFKMSIAIEVGKNINPLSEEIIQKINCRILNQIFRGGIEKNFIFFFKETRKEIKNAGGFLNEGSRISEIYLYFDCDGNNYSSQIDITKFFCKVSLAD